MHAAILGLLTLATSAAEPAKGVALHEWGVFNIFDDADLANAAMRREWSSLPRFVHGRLDGRVVPVHAGLVEVDKPVIHTHTDKPTALTIRVDFPRGRPMVWWPTNSNIPPSGAADPTLKQLVWRLHAGPFKSPTTEPKVEPLPEGHWMGLLRNVKAADLIFDAWSDDVARGGLRRREFVRERFVYYDGLVPAPAGVVAAVAADGTVTLTGAEGFDAADVWVIDRRADRLQVARLAELKARAVVKPVLADADPGAEAGRLTKSLTAAGLNADEAGSITAIWRREFFETPGVAVLYRIPQAEYDRLLPLTVEPRPETIVRVGLVRHVVGGDPALAAKVAGLVKQLDAEDFDDREAASRQLAELGPVAIPHLIRLRSGGVSAETRSRINGILERHLVPAGK